MLKIMKINPTRKNINQSYINRTNLLGKIRKSERYRRKFPPKHETSKHQSTDKYRMPTVPECLVPGPLQNPRTCFMAHERAIYQKHGSELSSRYSKGRRSPFIISRSRSDKSSYAYAKNVSVGGKPAKIRDRLNCGGFLMKRIRV